MEPPGARRRRRNGNASSSATRTSSPASATRRPKRSTRPSRFASAVASHQSSSASGHGSSTDGLFLSVFPILVVFSALAGTRLNSRLAGKVVIGVVALAASLAMTASYHSGYSDFRSDKMTKPLSGDVIRSAPTLLTLNPIGAPIAHAALHTSAVLHSYETDTFLPPHN